MPLTELQKRAAQAIVNIFETGKAEGDYANVTLLAGDPGHLTYGRSQTTLASGNLYLLIKAYCEAPDAAFDTELRRYLDRLSDRDLTLDRDMALRQLLREAGEDPVMRQTQDAFFDRVYWNPAVGSADTIGVTSPLGVTVVYDSAVHGSWKRLRDRTDSEHGKAQVIGQNRWIAAYIEERRDWLATSSITLLRKTVYRMDALKELTGKQNWTLGLPLSVRGVSITREILVRNDEARASAQDPNERILMLKEPPLTGPDVRQLQQALKNRGLTVSVDGSFGPKTAEAVKTFQSRRGLKADGIVGPATRAALGL